ncbi:MAG: hypothetical protein KBC84_02790 [Proteobacteria bacterium]|nr:hypothetical protein [Pseudomonadota bacterium]
MTKYNIRLNYRVILGGKLKPELSNTKKNKYIKQQLKKSDLDPKQQKIALRTAFVSRFIILREGRRSRAHRQIETMIWESDSSAEELFQMFRQAFLSNGDKLQPVDRDLKRALEHAYSSVGHFVEQYLNRATLNFVEALEDYEKSNKLLFGDDDSPRTGGWKLPEENN